MRTVLVAVLLAGLASLALADGPREFRQGLVAHFYQDPQYWGGTWPDSVSVPNSNPLDWTFTTYAYSRVEPLINHLFIRNGWFSIRWVGYINVQPGATGEVNPAEPDAPVEVAFEFWADDGARLFIDGQKLIDDWRACWEKTPESHRRATVSLTPGYHRIVVEYFQGQSLERNDHDPAKLYWTLHGHKQIIPAAHFFHTEEDLDRK